MAPATFSISFQQYTPVKTSAVHRSPSFVSPGTQSIVLNLITVNGSAPSSPVSSTANVSANGPGCSTVGNRVTCSISFNAPVGNDVFSATSYSGPNASGSQLGAATVPGTVTLNTQNLITLALGGTIASLQMFLQQSTFTIGTAATTLVVIVPLDSSGAQIVNPGNYTTPISVTSSAGAHFSMILDGSAVAIGGTATLASPSDQLVLSYDGAGSVSTTLTATAGAGISATISASGGVPGLNTSIAYNTATTPDHFQFTAVAQFGVVTVSGGTAPYTVVSSDTATATVTQTSPTTFQITAVGYGATGQGTATITITDSSTPTPQTKTESVSVLPAAIASTVGSCGANATCVANGTTTSITFPQTPATGSLAGETGTFSLSGGIGTYTYYFANSGTTTSAYATASVVGSSLTIAATGAGNDVLVVVSGSQTILIPIVTGSTFAASLPKAEGLLEENGVGKNFSVTLPTTVTAVTPLGGSINTAFAAHTLTATPTAGGTGSWQMTDATSDVANVPWTAFRLIFGTYAGSGAASSSETFNAPGADEAFTGNGETDNVIVIGVGGTLSVTSSNPNLVSVSGVTNTTFNVTSAASGNGFAAITLTDSGTGASATYSVSVTTTTIPIASRDRR